MRWLFIVLRIVFGVYLGLLLLVYLRQTHFIFHPDKEVDLDPSAIHVSFQDLSLTTVDGETIAGWYIPALNEESAPVLLYFHGNGGNISDCLEAIETFHYLNLNVLIIDYRGYGRSTGKPTEKGTARDADAAWRYLTEARGIAPNRIIIYGRSLGGAVAVSCAARHTPALLVIESSFSSAVDMGQRMFPYLPVRMLCRHPYNSETTIASVTCPILVAHSPDDTTVPFALGQKLFAAANPPKTFIVLSGNHNDSGLSNNSDYRKTFITYVNQYIPHS